MMTAWKGKGRAYSSAFVAKLPDIGIPTTSRRGAMIARARAQMAEVPACNNQAELRPRVASRWDLERHPTSKKAIWQPRRQDSQHRTYATAGAALAEVEEDSGRDATFEAEVWARQTFEMGRRREAAGIGVSAEHHKWMQTPEDERDGGVGQARTANGDWDGASLMGIGNLHSNVESPREGPPPGEVPYEIRKATEGEAKGRAKGREISAADSAHDRATRRLRVRQRAELEKAGVRPIQVLPITPTQPTDGCLALVALSRRSYHLHRSWRTDLFNTFMDKRYDVPMGRRAKHLEVMFRILQDTSDAEKRVIRTKTLCGIIDIMLTTSPEQLLQLHDVLDPFFQYCIATISTVGDRGIRTLSSAQTLYLKKQYLGKTIKAAMRCRMTLRAVELVAKGREKGFLHGRLVLHSTDGERLKAASVGDDDIVHLLEGERDPGVLELLTGAAMPEKGSRDPPHARILELRMRALLKLRRAAEAVTLFDRYHHRSGLSTRLVALGLRLCAVLALSDVNQAAYCWARMKELDIASEQQEGSDMVQEYWATLCYTIAKGSISPRAWKEAFRLEVWKFKEHTSLPVQNAMISSGLALDMQSEVDQLLVRLHMRPDSALVNSQRENKAKGTIATGDARTYTILLNASRRDGRGLQYIQEIWRDYQRLSLTHDSRALAALVRALVETGSLDAAIRLLQSRALGVVDEWETMETRVTPEVLNPVLARLSMDFGTEGAVRALSLFSAFRVRPDRTNLRSIVMRVGYQWNMPAGRQRDLMRHFESIIQPSEALNPVSTTVTAIEGQPNRPHRTLAFPTPDLCNIPSPVALYSEVERRHGSVNADHLVRIVQAYLDQGAVDLAISATLEAARRKLPGLDGVSKLIVTRLAYEHEISRCKTVLWELRALGQPLGLDDMVSIGSHMEKQGYFHMAAGFLSACASFTRVAADDVADSLRFRVLMRDRQGTRAISQVAKRDRPLTDALRYDILRFSQWHKTHAASGSGDIVRELRALLDKPYTREAERCAEIKARVGKALKIAIRNSTQVKLVRRV